MARANREKQGRGDLRIAAVGLIGAVIGGVLSTGGVIYSERAQADREEQREERLAQGAARLLVDEYREVGLYLERCLQTGKLFPVPSSAAIEISDEDRKRMASHLSSDAYGRASEAVQNVNLSTTALKRADREEGPYPVLSEMELTVIDAALVELAEGREALRPLTGETAAITPTPPLRRPQPGHG